MNVAPLKPALLDAIVSGVRQIPGTTTWAPLPTVAAVLDDLVLTSQRLRLDPQLTRSWPLRYALSCRVAVGHRSIKCILAMDGAARLTPQTA